ncbi:MAG: hydroxyacid dehydrogenase [Phycisphaerae bacterium]|nr:hydroxyacid dehydrogenase [Phycisphaerae bacterium]
MDAFFYEVFDEERDAILRYLPADARVEMTPATPQELGHDAPPAKILSTRTQSKIPHAWAGELTALLTRSTGYDHIVRYAREANFTGQCGYLPLYCARAVAEQACMLWMALLRRLPLQRAQFGAFHRDGLTGREALDKTLVVVGVGNIGHEIVKIGCGLGMNVIGVDIDPRHDDVTYAAVNDALPRADVIACAMNLTADNAGYFNTERLSKCKPGAIFVNIARGELSPTADLLSALDEGKLAGVGLDVYEEESALAVALRAGDCGLVLRGEAPLRRVVLRNVEDPLGADCGLENKTQSSAVRAALELAKRPDAILTPHNAFNTAEALERKAQQTAESLTAFLQTGKFPHPVPIC